MNKIIFKTKLISLGAILEENKDYTLFKFDEGTSSTIELAVYLYSEDGCSVVAHLKNNTALCLASETYEIPDYKNKNDIFNHALGDIEAILSEGVECSAKRGFLFVSLTAKLMKSRRKIFHSANFKYGNFNLPKNSGVIGVMKPKTIEKQ